VTSSTDFVGRWLFSHEEGGVRVYRTREAPVPPGRRPRDGFEIGEDGRYRHLQPGAGDAPAAVEGRWQVSGEHVTLTQPGAAFEVVAAGGGELRIRRAR
jgi:hypothetical protein